MAAGPDLPAKLDKAARFQVTTAQGSLNPGNTYGPWYKVHGLDLFPFRNEPVFGISFYVFTNVPGNYPIEFANSNFSARYTTMYSIPANVWTRIFIPLPTLPVDTVGAGNWLFERGQIGFYIRFWLGKGADGPGSLDQWSSQDSVPGSGSPGTGFPNHFGDTVGNFWQVTGLQVLPGHRLLPYQNRYSTFDEELTACKKYFEKSLFHGNYVNLDSSPATVQGGFTADPRPFVDKTEPGVGGGTRVGIFDVNFEVEKWKSGTQRIFNHRGNFRENFLSVYNGDTNQSVTLTSTTCSLRTLNGYAEAGTPLSTNRWGLHYYADCEL